MAEANDLLSINFIIANVGPMLSISLKVSGWPLPIPLKAIIVKACNKQKITSIILRMNKLN